MSGDRPCTYSGCSAPAFVFCAHAARCGDHMYGDMCGPECCAELAVAYVRFLRDVCGPAMRLGEQLVLIRIPVLEMFTHIYDYCTPVYREMYEEAGSPLGDGDAAMWRWHEERLQGSAEPRYTGLRLVNASEGLIQ